MGGEQLHARTPGGLGPKSYSAKTGEVNENRTVGDWISPPPNGKMAFPWSVWDQQFTSHRRLAYPRRIHGTNWSCYHFWRL